MELSHEQASSALQDIARAQRRLGIFTGYHRAAPHLGWWGAIWICGYVASDLWPQRAGWAWLVLNLVGLLGGTLIVRRQQAAADPLAVAATGAGSTLRMLGAGLAMALFIVASFDLLQPQSAVQFGVFPVLLMGLLYTLLGLWIGARWLATGLVLTALAVLGFHFVGEHTLLVVGTSGGIALILSGLWMQSR